MIHSDSVFIVFDLEEGKSFADIKTTGVVRQKVIDSGFDFDRRGFLSHRTRVTTVSNKKFEDLVKETEQALSQLAVRYTRKMIPYRILVTRVKSLMRESYKEAFQLGFTSSGAVEIGAGWNSYDRKYIESSVREEMRYLERVLAGIRDGQISGENIEKRLRNYAAALKHQYYSGRVMGTPSNMVVDWVSPLDRSTCKSCHWLSEHSPYTKESLPTTPKAGDTCCLHNCRCRLVMRSVNEATLKSVKSGHYSKERYIKKLEAIKAGRAV